MSSRSQKKRKDCQLITEIKRNSSVFRNTGTNTMFRNASRKHRYIQIVGNLLRLFAHNAQLRHCLKIVAILRMEKW